MRNLDCTDNGATQECQYDSSVDKDRRIFTVKKGCLLKGKHLMTLSTTSSSFRLNNDKVEMIHLVVQSLISFYSSFRDNRTNSGPFYPHSSFTVAAVRLFTLTITISLKRFCMFYIIYLI